MAIAALFFVLTWLTVGLRVYVRGIMLKTWGRDDWAMVATLVRHLAFPSQRSVTDRNRPSSQSTSPSKWSPPSTEQVAIDGS